MPVVHRIRSRLRRGSRARAGPGKQGTSRCALVEVEENGPADTFGRGNPVGRPIFFYRSLGGGSPCLPGPALARRDTAEAALDAMNDRVRRRLRAEASSPRPAAPWRLDGLSIGCGSSVPGARGRDRYGFSRQDPERGLGRSGAKRSGDRARCPRSGHPPNRLLPFRAMESGSRIRACGVRPDCLAIALRARNAQSSRLAGRP